MNARSILSLAAATAVILCAALTATATTPNSGQQPSAIPAVPGLIRNAALVGTMVLYPQGQDLGQIKDVLFDSQTGQATFVILDAKANHAMLVVPYQALQVSLNPADNRLSIVLGLRPDRLTAAPQIQNGQWQMLQNPQFLELARSFYQVKAYYAARPIDNPSTSSPPPSVMPQPCVNPAVQSSDLPQNLIDFYNE
jgi:hypothetical protein